MSAHVHDDRDDIQNPEVRHETRDISTRVVVIFGVSLVVAAILIHFLVWLLYLFYGSMQARAYPREYPLAQVGPPPEPPTPRLQVKPREDLKNLRAEEDQFLNSYGWVDASTVHIPIDRAMRLLLQQGLPSRQQPPDGAPGGMPTASSSGRMLVPRERF